MVMNMKNIKLRHYYCINDFVKLYFDNGKILLVSKTQFAPNFQDFFDLSFDEIRKKYKTFLIK